ncbi:MAG: DUF1156 domain-containing protein, partial [bacterium]
MTYRKKLIEVALPLEEINKQSSREKSIRHGHPSTLHLWWARRPLAACRAVLFSSLVDDPGEYLPEKEAEVERQRLHRLIEQLVNWDNINNETLLAQARLEIAHSVARNLNVEVPIGDAAIREFLVEKAPPVHDPFAGGGSIPLEAQRLGLRAFASDLNPVAVLINKALIEIPPKFANRPPVHPVEKSGQASFAREWRGAAGLAEDVRYYGKWMRDEAEKRIGHLYPKIKLPSPPGRGAGGEGAGAEGQEATVIAWLWARTVKCPNPACGATMPLVRSFWLSKKKGKYVWLEPVVDSKAKSVEFSIMKSEATTSNSTFIDVGSGFLNDKGKKVKATFRCLICKDGLAKGEYINSEAEQGRMKVMPLAIIADSAAGRGYLPFDESHVRSAVDETERYLSESSIRSRIPTEPARGTFAGNAQGRIYGFKTFADYFTLRQLVALTTFSDLVSEAREHVRRDAVAAGLANDSVLLNDDGTGAQAYTDAVATYLAMGVSRLSDICNALCRWESSKTQVRNLFARQAIPMVW